MVSPMSLDSVAAKVQPKNNRDANTRRSGFQLGGSPCRRLKKAIRKIRNRRQTKTGPRMCRPTRRRKARASQPARSRKRLDAKFVSRRICGNVDRDELPPIQPDDDESIEQVEVNGRDNEQIHGSNVWRVVTQKVC